MTAKAKLKNATWDGIVVAATGLGYGALKGREVNLPKIDVLGEAGTWGAGAFVGGHLLGVPALKLAGAMLGGFELMQRGERWFATKKHKKLLDELAKKKAELEKTIKGLEDDEYYDLPPEMSDDDGVELSGEAVQG